MACPIELAFRPADLEVQGTEYSAWHFASIPMLAKILVTWSDEIEGTRADEFALFKRMFDETRAYTEYQLQVLKKKCGWK